MNKHILFIQGGGSDEDYETDAKLVESLQQILGASYQIHYPFLATDSGPDFGRCKQISEALAKIKDRIVVVGHSLGASMLLKYCSENETKDNLVGMFLIATPFWQGEETWKQGLKLHESFEKSLPKTIPIFFYHSRDDQEVPFEHLSIYAQKLPKAFIQEITSGGHQLDNDLSIVAKDIKSIF